jgi:hypothetical protein
MSGQGGSWFDRLTTSVNSGPKRPIVVPDAPHHGSLRSEVWQDIERWIRQCHWRGGARADCRAASLMRKPVRACT